MTIAENFTRIKNDISNRAGLIAVSKTQSAEKIAAALQTGHRIFGENRVQEAISHWSEYRKTMADLELHLIGPLQTNKAKEAVALFDVIQTLDREKMVEAIAKEQAKQKRSLQYFIQVNTGNEDQKAGVSVDGLEKLLKYAQEKNLKVVGLMCIPPVDENPELHFKILKKIAADNNLPELSMGMSGDYEAAIEQGATYVRIGTALFGDR